MRISGRAGRAWWAMPTLLPSLVLLLAASARGQATISVGSQRPFVTGIVPVVGNGAVGGVSIDSKGAVSRSTSEAAGKLKAARLDALRELPGELNQSSPLRKVSLRRLEAEIDRCRRAGEPLSDEVRFLAGLQRVRYVFVYPELRDIVLAGPAEGWTVDEDGFIVGSTTGRPVLQLDDLLVALQTADSSAGSSITCSIDPTRQGVLRLQGLLRSRSFIVTAASLSRLEEAAGPQQVTIQGVPASSRFARVMLAADFLMKRLAMGFEAAPVSGLPGYMELVQSSRKRAPRNLMPRWWLAPRYEPLLRDSVGLSWELRRIGVEAKTEERAHPLVRRWAVLMTEHYEGLSEQLPVFAELQNCMDLAVVAALIAEKDLRRRARCPLPLLTDPKLLQPAAYHVPKTIPSQANAVRKGRAWVVSVSGGVAIDTLRPLKGPEDRLPLARTRKQAAPKLVKRWWWD